MEVKDDKTSNDMLEDIYDFDFQDEELFESLIDYANSESDANLIIHLCSCSLS